MWILTYQPGIDMKITLEPYSGGTYTAQTEAEHISEVVNMFKGLLVQTGYHPRTVDECFNEFEIETWFPEKENDSKLSEQDYECHSQTS